MYIVACEYPLLNQSMRSSLNVLDYKEPAVVGTTVSFNCSQPGEELTGPDRAMCMDDGQWVPDPDQIQISCKGIFYRYNMYPACYHWYVHA